MGIIARYGAKTKLATGYGKKIGTGYRRQGDLPEPGRPGTLGNPGRRCRKKPGDVVSGNGVHQFRRTGLFLGLRRLDAKERVPRIVSILQKSSSRSQRTKTRPPKPLPPQNTGPPPRYYLSKSPSLTELQIGKSNESTNKNENRRGFLATTLVSSPSRIRERFGFTAGQLDWPTAARLSNPRSPSFLGRLPAKADVRPVWTSPNGVAAMQNTDDGADDGDPIVVLMFANGIRCERDDLGGQAVSRNSSRTVGVSRQRIHIIESSGTSKR